MISALQLGHQWWCRVGECIAARTLVVVLDWSGAAAHSPILEHKKYNYVIIKQLFDRLSLAGDVLQTALLLINSLIN